MAVIDRDRVDQRLRNEGSLMMPVLCGVSFRFTPSFVRPPPPIPIPIPLKPPSPFPSIRFSSSSSLQASACIPRSTSTRRVHSRPHPNTTRTKYGLYLANHSHEGRFAYRHHRASLGCCSRTSRAKTSSSSDSKSSHRGGAIHLHSHSGPSRRQIGRAHV